MSSPHGHVDDGRREVTTAGTRVQLTTTPTRCKSVAITAETDNTGIITVGGPNVVAALATRRGVALAAGATVSLEVDNLTHVYLDSTVNTEGVTYTYTW